MQITQLEVKLYRSLFDFRFSPQQASVICGPNSCGKSNVLRALRFAFTPQFDPGKMLSNLSHLALSPNAAAKVKIAFNAPTLELAAALGIPQGQPFTYAMQVKRNGKAEYHLNGARMTADKRAQLLAGIVVVYVPPIRDLAAGGLEPFRATLAAAFRKARGNDSLNQLTPRVNSAIERSGRVFLAGVQNTATRLLKVDRLSMDTDQIDLNSLIPLAGLKYTVAGRDASIDKLGTGHQSSVILGLYRQLGLAAGKFVLYLFEEPDNHLHPTSLRAIAEDLKSCCAPDAQVVITTHSPYLLNQFPIRSWVPLTLTPNRTTNVCAQNIVRTDHELRIAFGKYGLKPAEALLASKVLVVEGPIDVALVRKLIELDTGSSVDRKDLLIIPAGGKSSVADLCLLLQELGANWMGVFDWDATEDTRQPMFRAGLSAQQTASFQQALNAIRPSLRPLSATRASKMQKAIDSMLGELAQPAAFPARNFDHSVLGTYLTEAKSLSVANYASLKAAVRRGAVTAARALLEPARIWLWSTTPEEVLIDSVQAENIVEALLVARQEIQQPYQAATRASALQNFIHARGHDPALLEDIVSALWLPKLKRRREIRGALKAMLP